MFPEVLKPKTIHNMITYKSKVVHNEEDIINLSPIRQNRNYYPRKEKTVVMTTVWLFYMTSTCLKPPFMVIHISEVI